MVRKILVLSLVLVMALAFIACDGGGEGLPTAQEVIDGSIQALEEVRTCEFDMEMNMDMDIEAESIDATVDMDASGALDIENYQMQTTLAMNMAATGEEDMDIEAEMYLVDNTFYIFTDALGMGPMWMKLGMEELEELPEEYWEPGNMLELQTELLEAFEIEVTGSKRVDGIDCYVLESTPDMEQLWKLMMQMYETTGLETADMPEDFEEYFDEMFRSFSVKQWVAKDTYFPMKVEVEIAMEFTPEAMGYPEEEGEGAIDLFMSLLIFNYNQPVSIELPPEAENAMDIMDFTDYMDY